MRVLLAFLTTRMSFCYDGRGNEQIGTEVEERYSMAIDPNQNTYVVDAESMAEMTRLIEQDITITQMMGGVFPPDLDLTGIHKILDVACGPGGWVREVAYQYPDIQVHGIDKSRRMIEYAQAFVGVQELENVTFSIADVLQPLDFPDATFDLVNARALVAFVPKTAWPGLVKEFARITRPGGVIILTECDNSGDTNSPAYERYKQLVMQAMAATGLSHHPYGTDWHLTPFLGKYLQDAGCEQISLKAHVLDFSAGAPARQGFYENVKIAFKLVQPFVIKQNLATQKELDLLYDQVLAEMLSDDFRALMYWLTTWGIRKKS